MFRDVKIDLPVPPVLLSLVSCWCHCGLCLNKSKWHSQMLLINCWCPITLESIIMYLIGYLSCSKVLLLVMLYNTSSVLDPILLLRVYKSTAFCWLGLTVSFLRGLLSGARVTQLNHYYCALKLCLQCVFMHADAIRVCSLLILSVRI